MTHADLTSYFSYLDALRISGVTNMFGAAPYVSEAFDVDAKVARKALTLWMETFNDKPPEERATIALNK